jgi:salicylate 5-hydroxylase small subunit
VILDAQLRQDVADLYAAYAACLDDGRYEEWPEFFVDDGWYRVVPRENFEQDLPLSTLSLKGKAMMMDRIYGVQSTIFHAPYYQRHVVGLPTIRADASSLQASANYIVVRTKRDVPAEIYSVGRYIDTIVTTEQGLKFSKKFCVFDNELISNSMIYPI